MYQKSLSVGSGAIRRCATPSGVPVTSFSVATDRRWTDQNGQLQERTVWFRAPRASTG